MQRQTAVTFYYLSNQFLLFAFVLSVELERGSLHLPGLSEQGATIKAESVTVFNRWHNGEGGRLSKQTRYIEPLLI